MSFSNTNVENADPYKSKNLENPELEDKVGDLIAFVEKCKFCMMGTRTSDGLIVSRCMALAGKVRQFQHTQLPNTKLSKHKTTKLAAYTN